MSERCSSFNEGSLVSMETAGMPNLLGLRCPSLPTWLSVGHHRQFPSYCGLDLCKNPVGTSYSPPKLCCPGSPCFRAVLFASNRDAPFRIYRQDIDQNTAELITHNPGYQNGPRMSPDGQYCLVEMFLKRIHIGYVMFDHDSKFNVDVIDPNINRFTADACGAVIGSRRREMLDTLSR
jgi:hypothetical protein